MARRGRALMVSKKRSRRQVCGTALSIEQPSRAKMGEGGGRDINAALHDSLRLCGVIRPGGSQRGSAAIAAGQSAELFR